MRGSRGFTLAELLIVIAIMAILVGLLLPVFLHVQESARMRVCASNLRELGQAFRSYIDDYNGFALPAPYPAEWYFRPDPMLKYTKQTPVDASESNPTRLWICPGDRSVGCYPPIWKWDGVAYSSYLYPYGAYLATSEHTDVKNLTTPVNTPRRVDMWAHVTRDILLCDWATNFHRGQKGADEGVKCVNFLMLDGHVQVGTRADRTNLLYFSVQFDNPYSPAYSPEREIPLDSTTTPRGPSDS